MFGCLYDRHFSGQEAQLFYRNIMNIGNAIKLARTSKKLTLNDLATLSELSQSYLSLIESGKRDPSLSILEKISHALKMPVPILIFLGSEQDEISGIDQETQNRLSQSVLEIIRE